MGSRFSKGTISMAGNYRVYARARASEIFALKN